MKGVVLLSIVYFISLHLFPKFGISNIAIFTNEYASMKDINDTVAIDSLNSLSYKLNYSDPDKALKLAKTALKNSKTITYQRGVGKAYLNTAIVYKNIGKYDSSSLFCDSAVIIFKTINNNSGLASVYNNLGTISYYKTDYKLAIKWYEKALNIYDDLKATSHSAILINNIGLALSEQGNYNKALEYYFRALKLHEEIENESGEALTLANIGIIYFNLGNLAKAMDFYKKSLTIRLDIEDHFGIAACYNNIGNVLMAKGEQKLALENYNKALKIFSEKRDIHNVASSYLVIGNYYRELQNYRDAIGYYFKALEIGKQIQSIHIAAHANLGIGEAFVQQKKYKQAFGYLRDSEKHFKEVGDLTLLTYVYRAMADFYEKTNQYDKALEEYKNYVQLNDSLLEVTSSKRVTEAELLYETEKKENEISLLTKEKELQKLGIVRQKQYSRILALIIAVILITAGFLFWRYIEKKTANKTLQRKNDLLAEKGKLIEEQKQKIEEQIKKLQELDDMKSRFFANISHEFRTPLTLIKGPVEDVLQSHDNELFAQRKRNLEISLENINKLRMLVDQILDLTKLQAGKLKLRTRRQDLIAFLARQINSFQSAMARKTNLNLSFHHSEKNLFLYFDENKLETAISNILSNAMKYSEDKGEIEVSVIDNKDCNTSTGDFTRIKISDTGKGIKPEDIKNIFSRFYRSQSASDFAREGTGIGLELTRELIELHGGSIFVESEYGKGTTFIINLPKGKDHLSDEEIVWKEPDTTGGTDLHEVFEKPDPPQSTVIPGSQAGLKQKILLVEDNKDMRNYILSHLKQYFTVVEGENGSQGLEKALENKPELIISDLMMPVMDGLQFLQEVRKNKIIHDIPFIMLTARADDEDRLSGYKAKADGYMTKPFNSEELLLRIQNLLYTRKHLQEKFSKKIISIDFNDQNLVSADKEFLNKMKTIIIENIANADFGMNDFADKAFLSERQLRRRLNEITGLGPVEFIRQIRLLKAKELLENKVYFSIAEVSAAVGFNNPHYFSRMYKKMFGVSPHDQLGKKVS